MQHIIENHPDMATALLAGEKLKELILPGQQDERAGALAALLLQLKLELPFDRVVTIGTVLVPILLVTLVFTKNFADPHPEKDALYSSETCRTVPAAGVFLTCNHKHIATSAAATNVTLSQAKSEPTPALNCNAAHPLLHINTLYEDHEEEVSNLIDDGIHSSTEPREILSIPTPKQRMIATFDEPMAIVSSVEY